ncbi:MAG: endonuclease/exonuclease/phosphatase family protein [Ardenticatenaceae bacterium]|nr:endonuclease/exonuclease/phosphatase family protein [Ardenticatenaceae bacterium]
MQTTTNRPDGRFFHIGLSALTMMFGMQTLRTFLPLLLYVLRDRFGWNAIQVGLFALAVFLTSFLAALVQRRLGRQRSLRWVLGGLGLLRLAYQIWWGDPLVDLYLVTGAVILFLWAIPICLGHTRSGGPIVTGLSAIGLLLGLVLDTAVHGLYLTYDMSWHNDLGTAVLVLFLVLCQWWLLEQLMAQPDDTRSTANDTLFPLAFVLLAVGPFLFLQLVIFQNIARLTTLTGWPQPLAFGWVLAVQLLGLVTAVLLYIYHQTKIQIIAITLGLLLVVTLFMGWPPGWWAAAFLLLGHVSSAGLLSLVFMGLGAGNGHAGLARITIGYGLSIVLLTLFAFIFYSSYDLPIPFPNTVLLPLAGLVIGIAGWGAAKRLAKFKTTAVSPPWRLAAVLLLLLLPIYEAATVPVITATSPNDTPIRVMTYNLHNGFDPQGYLGMEALAQVIEAQQPDVVALQEVSRGWAMNGSLDMMAWLSRRLEMPYIYDGTADPIWGNGLLSRYPILESELVSLPTDDLPIKRGFIWAKIDTGGQPLNIIATHFHHPLDGSPIRVLEAETILDYWGGNGRTLIMGDLNAEPGSPEIEMLRQAGFSDAADTTGASPTFTYPSTGPDEHIDYIWLTPDLTASDFVIPPEPASDHLGIAITIDN